MRYRAFDISVTPLQQNTSLVCSYSSRSSALLSQEVVRLLLSCRQFDTLEGHALSFYRAMARNWALSARHTESIRVRLVDWILRALFERGPEVPLLAKDVRVLHRQLSECVSFGLLTSEEDLLAKVYQLIHNSKPSETSRPYVSTVGILTCDRTASLDHCLTSYIENGILHERLTSFIVVDDSRNAGVCIENRQLVQALADRKLVDLFYADRQRRRAFALELSESESIPLNVLEFALLGDERCNLTVGASDNTVLLYTVGEVALLSDDDVLCKVAAVPNCVPGLALSSANDVNEYWFYESLDAALKPLSFENTDVLALHEKVLSRNLGDCIETFRSETGSFSFEEISPAFLRNLPEARVGVSQLGSVGDSGMERNLPRLMFREDSFRRLVGPEYSTNLSTRVLMRAPVQASITDGVFCMGMSLGLDNRGLLPPFMPVLRNCDGVFSAVLKVCFHHIFRGFLPYVVVHSPPELRWHDPELSIENGIRPRTNDLLIVLIYTAGKFLVGSNATERMQALGCWLRNLGSSSFSDFEEVVRTAYYNDVSWGIAGAERRIDEESGASEEWLEDMRHYISALQKSVADWECIVPVDLAGSAGERMKLFKELVCLYGELLIYWPEIVAVAIRKKGIVTRKAGTYECRDNENVGLSS